MKNNSIFEKTIEKGLRNAENTRKTGPMPAWSPFYGTFTVLIFRCKQEITSFYYITNWQPNNNLTITSEYPAKHGISEQKGANNYYD